MDVAAWSSRRELSALQTLLWRAEADPRMTAATVVVEILDRVPDWDRLVAAHEWGTSYLPRARQRVLDPPIGPAVWVPDDEFDLSYHLRRVRLPEPGTVRQLMELAQVFAMAPLHRERPPWEAVLVEGLDGDRAGYLLKLHHSLTDGAGGIHLLTLLHGRSREHNPDKPRALPPDVRGCASAARPDTSGVAGSGGVARSPGSRGVSGLPGAVARLAGGVLAHPQQAVGAVTGLARSLQRVFGPPPAPGSPLLAERGLAWRFVSHELPLATLKAAAAAADGSVNDAFLAALLGAFRRYHQHFGQLPEVMPVAFPISLRADEHAAGFTGARMAAPLAEPDPAERIRIVREFVLTARAEPAGDALNLLAPVLAGLPGPLLGRFCAALAGGNDLQASTIQGVGHPVYQSGARVTHLYPFSPRPLVPAAITMVSHDGTCCVGANLDPAAITDLDLFARCLYDGFDEVLALAR